MQSVTHSVIKFAINISICNKLLYLNEINSKSNEIYKPVKNVQASQIPFQICLLK